jgi:superfamily II DNA or RNA helicase
MDSISPPDLSLSDDVIKSLFGAKALDEGRVYELRGRVQNLQMSPDGDTIAATTVGTMPDPYTQRVTVKRNPFGPLLIAGRCSCPLGRGCKHLAAVLIAAHRQQRTGYVPMMTPVPAPVVRRGPGRPPVNRAPVLPPAPRAEPLPFPIGAWLDSLDNGDDSESEDYPPSVRNRVYYVLDAAPGPGGVPRLRVQSMNVMLRTNNLPGQSKPYPPVNVTNMARFVRPSDRAILARLLRAERPSLGIPTDDDPLDTLRRIVATGRATWGSVTGPHITEGDSIPAEIGWQTAPDGSQYPWLDLPGGKLAVRVPDPWYVDPVRGTMGPIALKLPKHMAVKMLAAPPIPAELTGRVRAEVERRLPGIKAPPVAKKVEESKKVTGGLVPHLRLLSGTLPADPYRGRGMVKRIPGGLFEAPLGRLSFGYAPVSLPYTTLKAPQLSSHNGVFYEPARDAKAEAAAFAKLQELGFATVSELAPSNFRHAHTDDLVLVKARGEADWLDFVTGTVPKLKAAGWTISVDEAFAVQAYTADSEIDAELIEGSGIDWLELNLGVMVNGERVDLVPALIRLINRPDLAAMLDKADDAPFTIPMAGGRLLAIPVGRIRPILHALMELAAGGGIDPDDEKIGFSRLDAVDLAALEERSGLVLRGGEQLRSLGQSLRESGGSVPVATVPKSFKGVLRPYQQQGVNWLQFLGSAGLGGVLADDMGLGKTVQTLAHLLIEQQAGRLKKPALIVCPTSLVPNWTMEAEKFAPSLKVLVLHGLDRKRLFKQIPKHDLVLTTYPLLARDHAVLTEQEWHVVILDEAQTIKNPNAETTRQALRLQAGQRLCLSGTPLQNHLGELWSLFDFLAPGFLGSQRAFKTRYRGPIEKGGDVERQTQLVSRVKPFLLRRTKDEVAPELPPKTEINEPVEMEEAQRGIYEGIRLSMHARVKAAIAEKGLARSGIIVLDALLKLRQACCDPRLIKLKAVERSKAGSAKLDRLMEMLTVMLEEGRKVLLFSQFTEMLGLIEERLKEDGIQYVLLTGDTKDRGAPVRRFQKGEVPLFLISLKAGGVGLNLTAADTVIHYDPWWNPAVEDQATDRAHRIGQEKKVFVHRLVTLGTIEEKMESLKEKKRGLVASVLEAEKGGALKMTEADVDALFGG